MAWLEKHLNNGGAALEPNGSNLNSNDLFKFSTTQNARIHAVGLCLGGPELTADEWGYMYLWRDATHFTFMMPIANGAPRQSYLALPDSGWVVEANGDFCFRWFFNALSVPRYIFADIAYTLETP